MGAGIIVSRGGRAARRRCFRTRSANAWLSSRCTRYSDCSLIWSPHITQVIGELGPVRMAEPIGVPRGGVETVVPGELLACGPDEDALLGADGVNGRVELSGLLLGPGQRIRPGVQVKVRMALPQERGDMPPRPRRGWL